MKSQGADFDKFGFSMHGRDIEDLYIQIDRLNALIYGLGGQQSGLSTTLSALSGTYLTRANNLSDLSSVTAAQTNLGLGSAATHASTDFLLTANSLSEIAGAGTGAAARSNIGCGNMAVQISSSVLITGGAISGLASLTSSAISSCTVSSLLAPIAILDGGTGATVAVSALANLTAAGTAFFKFTTVYGTPGSFTHTYQSGTKLVYAILVGSGGGGGGGNNGGANYAGDGGYAGEVVYCLRAGLAGTTSTITVPGGGGAGAAGSAGGNGSSASIGGTAIFGATAVGGFGGFIGAPALRTSINGTGAGTGTMFDIHVFPGAPTQGRMIGTSLWQNGLGGVGLHAPDGNTYGTGGIGGTPSSSGTSGIGGCVIICEA